VGYEHYRELLAACLAEAPEKAADRSASVADPREEAGEECILHLPVFA
jgi:hypothetical protein